MFNSKKILFKLFEGFSAFLFIVIIALIFDMAILGITPEQISDAYFLWTTSPSA